MSSRLLGSDDVVISKVTHLTLHWKYPQWLVNFLTGFSLTENILKPWNSRNIRVIKPLEIIRKQRINDLPKMRLDSVSKRTKIYPSHENWDYDSIFDQISTVLVQVALQGLAITSCQWKKPHLVDWVGLPLKQRSSMILWEERIHFIVFSMGKFF